MIFSSKKSVVCRAAFAICAVSAGGLVVLPAHAQATTAFAVLPTTAISLTADVTRVDGQNVELSSGWQQGLAVGMLLDVRDASGGVVGRIRLTEVMPQKSRGELVSSSGDVATARTAMAPYPLAITRIAGRTINFALPAGNRALNVGDTLTIVRAGQVVGHARFTGYNPVGATVTELTPGTTLRAGDVLWAYNDGGTAIVATPARHHNAGASRRARKRHRGSLDRCNVERARSQCCEYSRDHDHQKRRQRCVRKRRKQRKRRADPARE